MSFTVPASFGGAAFAVLGGKQIQFETEASVDFSPTNAVLASALYGKYDEIPNDLIVRVSGTPRYYDTANNTTMFPYIGGVSVGTVFGGGNVACDLNSINSDQLILNNAIVGKMPDLILGINKCVMGPMEIWGIIKSGENPTATDAYYTFNAAGGSYTYAFPTTPGTAVEGMQEFTGVFGSVAGMTSFQVQETWTISHELELRPIPIQYRTRAFRLVSYRTMVKCKPADATMAALLTALEIQGANATMGTKLSQLAKAANSGASVPTLAITGTASISATVNGCALKTAGMMFGSEPLRQGEVGFISTQPATGSPTAPLVLA